MLEAEAPPVEESAAAAPEAQAEQEAARRAAVVAALGHRLRSEFRRRQTDRREVELRWLRDLRQYNGEYEPEVQQALTDRKYGSKAFVPLTRRICLVVEARLGDLLFPTDDRNFTISPSPVPELADAEALAHKLPPGAPVDAGGFTTTAAAVKLSLRDLREEAEKRATGMQRVVDDQLQQSRYPIEARKVIHDAIKLGTGVLKGPVVFGRMRKQWSVEGNVGRLSMIEDLSPAAVRVDLWNFYPDLSETELSPESSVFELHPLTKLGLAKLAGQDGFDIEAIKRVLEAGSDQTQDANRDATRVASGTVGVRDPRYNVVEYTGPVDAEELQAYGLDLGAPGDASLLVHQACVWFSEKTGEVLKAVLYPMDANEQPYSVFNWMQDTACVFGYGLPYELRDMQEGANSVFRAMQDNGGLSVGPQIVIDQTAVEPVNSQWVIEPNKLWRKTDRAVPVNSVFGFYNIESRVTELLAVFNQIKALADEIGGPLLAMQGQEAPKLAQAGATGMSIAYNTASIWMRRGVKLWDDQITTPVIGRFVDWNMQNHTDASIKGDLRAVPRGTSALLDAEGQIIKLQTVIQFASQVGVPVRKVVNQLRAMVKAMRLDPDDLLPDDAEIKAMEDAAAANGPPPNPEMERIQARKMELEDRKAQREHDFNLRLMENEIRWAEIASNAQMSAEEARARFALDRAKLAAQVEDRREQRAHDAQAFNTEIAVKVARGSGI